MVILFNEAHDLSNIDRGIMRNVYVKVYNVWTIGSGGDLERFYFYA